ncbi:MAG: hypothetical protein ACR2OU_06720 [Thermomicrobiales bacterium]
MTGAAGRRCPDTGAASIVTTPGRRVARLGRVTGGRLPSIISLRFGFCLGIFFPHYLMAMG